MSSLTRTIRRVAKRLRRKPPVEKPLAKLPKRLHPEEQRRRDYELVYGKSGEGLF